MSRKVLFIILIFLLLALQYQDLRFRYFRDFVLRFINDMNFKVSYLGFDSMAKSDHVSEKSLGQLHRLIPSDLENAVDRYKKKDANLINLMSRFYHLESKVLDLEGVNQELLKNVNNVHVFRSERKSPNTEDTVIFNVLETKVRDSLTDRYLAVGATDDVVYMSMIKFNDLSQLIKKNIRIISATLYLKQARSLDMIDNFNEQYLSLVYNRSEIKQGRDNGNVDQCYEFNRKCREGVISMHSHGIYHGGLDQSGFSITEPASVFKSSEDTWILFRFNEHGKDWLYEIRDGVFNNNGLSLINAHYSHNNMQSMVYFHSTESPKEEDRPYLEIIYADN